MNLRELIDQKVNWLKQADEEHIAQKISVACFVLGVKVEDTRNVNYNKLLINNIEFNATQSTLGFNTSIGDFNHKLAGWVVVEGVCVCRLVYINDIPKFPISAKSILGYDIESDDYIFIPGAWLDVLNEKYDTATHIINSKKIEDEKTRTRKLAAQLLIDPKVEV